MSTVYKQWWMWRRPNIQQVDRENKTITIQSATMKNSSGYVVKWHYHNFSCNDRWFKSLIPNTITQHIQCYNDILLKISSILFQTHSDLRVIDGVDKPEWNVANSYTYRISRACHQTASLLYRPDGDSKCIQMACIYIWTTGCQCSRSYFSWQQIW